MDHTMFHKVENSNLAILLYNKRCFYSSQNKCRNMKEIVLLQSMHTMLKKKICFDASHNVPTCRKGPNMWKTVFLKLLLTILLKKIRFDALHNVPSGRKQ